MASRGQKNDGRGMTCRECGGEMEIVCGVSHHVGDAPDGIDHDADGDHVPVRDDHGAI